ncbi:MAG: antitoxin [Crocosphaera sp.]|nr:antitoxin [Crocosphaera sp.]
MKSECDLANIKLTPNPYAKQLKQQIILSLVSDCKPLPEDLTMVGEARAIAFDASFQHKLANQK